MKSKSLRITKQAIIEVLKELDINEQDKVELMINLSKFLNPDEYEENIKTLNEKRRFR